jgi:hypothetical protein
MRSLPQSDGGEAVLPWQSAIVVNKKMAFPLFALLDDRGSMMPRIPVRRWPRVPGRMECLRANRDGHASNGKRHFRFEIARKSPERRVVCPKVVIDNLMPIPTAPHKLQHHAVCAAASED